MLKNYKLILEVRTPVFIGSGEEISKKDCLYLNNERMVYVLDNMKVFAGLKKAGLLKKYEDFLMDFRQKNFSVFTRENNISLNVVKNWAAYTLPMNDITDINNSRSKGGGSDNILAFIKDSFGCPYVPGSSLKGALRTVIQNAYCEDRRSGMEQIRNSISEEQFRNRKGYLSAAEKKLSSDFFNTLDRKEKNKNDAVNDVFAGIRISDSSPLEISSLILCQKIDVKPDGSYASLPIKRECLKPGTKLCFSLEIDTDMMDITPDDLCRYAESVFDEYRADFLDKFSESSITPVTLATPLILGGGTGYVSKTSVYSLYEDKNAALKTVQKIMIETTSTRKQRDPHKHIDDTAKHKVSPHIRKCTQYNGKIYDMGICDMRIEEV